MSADPTSCRGCGHPHEIGRFCTNCGRPRETLAPDDSRVATAERPSVPSVPPVEPATDPPSAPPPTQPSPPPPHPPQPPLRAVAPPPVYEVPQPPRFPLWADQSASPPSGPPPGAPAGAPPRARRPAVAWLAVAAVLFVLIGVGGVLLVGRDDPATGPESASPDQSGTPGSPSEPAPTASGEAAANPVDLARSAEVTPPDTAGPSRDVRGNAVRYEAFNMLDGQPDTAWRMAGDGSGREIVLRLDAPTVISEVGLINGYAKVVPGYDGYRANRRITAVEWELGDGTVVPQDLSDTLDVQRIAVDDVVTDVVTLRIVEVTGPADGPAGRDYTAISEIALVGSPA